MFILSLVCSIAAAAAAAGIAPSDTNVDVNVPASDAAAPPPTNDQAQQAASAGAAETGSAAFPYPAEYQYQEKKEDTKENFPYPAEYMAPSSNDVNNDGDDIDGGDEFDDPSIDDGIVPDGATPTPTMPEVKHEEFGSWFGRISGTIKEWMGWTQSAADSARDDYARADREKRDLHEKLDQIEQLLSHDYGMILFHPPPFFYHSLYYSHSFTNLCRTYPTGSDGEFTSLQGKCFSLVQRQYTYEICPYDEGRQKEGGSSTSLGKWKGWGDRTANGDRVMKFENGVRCWNGPDRSLAVTYLYILIIVNVNLA
jgi:hypothetical protein